MGSSLKRFLAESRPDGAPQRVWFDPVLVIGFVGATVVELVLKARSAEMLPVPLAFFLVFVPLPVSLLWRRSHPFVALATVLITLTLFDIGLALAGESLPDIISSVYGVILIYAVFRWGSGREALWSVGALAVVLAVDFAVGLATWGEVIGGVIFLALMAETGVLVRRNHNILEARSLNVRSAEREQLARELHDSVAHHVSAIAVQAQAGRAVMEADPALAASTFDAIEESASRALGEMRTVVEALRTNAPRTPSRSIEHLDDLVGGPGPLVKIESDVAPSDLAPTVSAAIYRLAQESVTNSRRHAVNATEIVVTVKRIDDRVCIRVVDDGDPVGPRSSNDRYGLTGMEERATLLGGSFVAGPEPRGGWVTEAAIPLDGKARSPKQGKMNQRIAAKP